MNALKRGRGNKATPEERKQAMQWQNQRVKIANLIARKPEIPKICCICGKEGKILHNRKDPYYITFICDECKTEPNNLIIAEESRFDLRTKLDKSNLCVHNFLDEQIVRIITGYMNDIISLGDYCEKIGISRHQFGQVVQRYKQLFPKQNIEQLIKNRTKKVQSEKLKKIAEEKALI